MFKALRIAMGIVPNLVTLMAEVEEFNKDGTWTGEEKKQFVLDALKATFQTMVSVSTGGQLETWQRIEPRLSVIVDELAAIMFPKE